MKKLRVLIVEDEVLIAQDLKRKLIRLGHEVLGVIYNSNHVTDAIVAKTPDLILLDIHIKGERNGIEMAHLINAHYQIPFIYVTSYADQKSISEVQKTDPIGYVVKPFDENDLKVEIEMGLHRLQKMQSPSFPTRETLNQALEIGVSPKEYEILLDLKEGLTVRTIADKHFISQNTVRTHVKKLFAKCNVHSKVALINVCLRLV